MNTVKEYDDKEFKEHFRVNRSTVDLIIGKYDKSRSTIDVVRLKP